MPKEVKFYFVDVFADGPLRGNPVSLVCDADDLDETTMRAIGRELNQSETVFLLEPTIAGATVRLRSFTPTGAEVFGAGHNALGAWLWMAAAGKLPLEDVPPALTQQIGDEMLPVEVTRTEGGPVVVSMLQSAPRFGESVDDRRELAESLGLVEDDLVKKEPAQVVSTGAGHLLVPLTSRLAVDRAAPEGRRLTAVLEKVGGEGCYLYSRDPIESSDAVAYTRFFNPIMGITEVPATGTAAGHIADHATVIVEQGYALGRPSRIRVTVIGTRVHVSGSGVVVAEGKLFL